MGFLLRLPAQALPMWPSGSGGNPKKITHDVGPRSLQGEVELTSNRIDLPLCLAASYPPCSFNVACGGLVLLAAQSKSTMKPQRNRAFPVHDMLCNTGERTGRARSSPRTHSCHTWPARVKAGTWPAPSWVHAGETAWCTGTRIRVLATARDDSDLVPCGGGNQRYVDTGQMSNIKACGLVQGVV